MKFLQLILFVCLFSFQATAQATAQSRSVKNEITQPQYIQFKLQNNSVGRKHFYVKGPKGKKFSYGFPMNPLEKRAENWPVGSKVYLEGKFGKRDLLVTIKTEDKGGIVKLFTKKNEKSNPE